MVCRFSNIHLKINSLLELSIALIYVETEEGRWLPPLIEVVNCWISCMVQPTAVAEAISEMADGEMTKKDDGSRNNSEQTHRASVKGRERHGCILKGNLIRWLRREEKVHNFWKRRKKPVWDSWLGLGLKILWWN